MAKTADWLRTGAEMARRARLPFQRINSRRWGSVALVGVAALGLGAIPYSIYDFAVTSTPTRHAAEQAAKIEAPPPSEERLKSARAISTKVPIPLATAAANLDWPGIQATITTKEATDARAASLEQAGYEIALTRIEGETGVTDRRQRSALLAVSGFLAALAAGVVFIARDS